MTPLERVWDAGRPVDIHGTLWPLRRGAGDPAHRVDPSGVFWWTCRTPQGAGTLALSAISGSAVVARAWGSGAQWLLDRVPQLLGRDDDWSALDVSGHRALHDVRRRRLGVRLPATGLVLDSLVPAVLEQRVTGQDARRAWRTLLYRFGEAAPGPVATMRVPPPADVLLEITSWDWHRMGVDLQRQRAVRAAATVAPRLEECVELSGGAAETDAAIRRLLHLPGIGVWTAAETMQRAVGHPDAVSVGDYHLKDVVVHFLTGHPRGTDERMLELLEPWSGHRQRVVRLIEMSGVGKPRFGPRFAPVDIRAI